MVTIKNIFYENDFQNLIFNNIDYINDNYDIDKIIIDNYSSNYDIYQFGTFQKYTLSGLFKYIKENNKLKILISFYQRFLSSLIYLIFTSPSRSHYIYDISAGI